MQQAVTAVPTALAGVSAGTKYFLRNESIYPLLVAIQAAAPEADTADRFSVGGKDSDNRDLYPTADTGESIWVWSRDGSGSVVYVESN